MRPIFVFIKCELGKAYEVAAEIVDRIEETSEVYSVSGQYDLLIKAYLPEESDDGRFVCEKLQAVPHIRDTFTISTYKAFTA